MDAVQWYSRVPAQHRKYFATPIPFFWGDSCASIRLDPELLPQDFDPEYGVGPPDGPALEESLFGDLIGCKDIKIQLSRIRSTFLHAQRLGRDPLEVCYIRVLGCPGSDGTGTLL